MVRVMRRTAPDLVVMPAAGPGGPDPVSDRDRGHGAPGLLAEPGEDREVPEVGLLERERRPPVGGLEALPGVPQGGPALVAAVPLEPTGGRAESGIGPLPDHRGATDLAAAA
jgi:hypothetical protein